MDLRPKQQRLASMTPPSFGRRVASKGNLSAHKQDFLSKFQDESDDVFGDPYEDNLFAKLDDPYVVENNFKTLRISPSQPTLRIKSNNRPSLSPHNDILKYQEPQMDSFDEDFLDLDQNPRQNTPAKLMHTPTTMSTLSPKRAKSLSEYSEGTNDTDVTPFEDDFDDADDIFGAEESGLYNKAAQRLLMNQRKLQTNAEIEERELYKKYNNYKKDEVNTLRLRDLHCDAEKTVNYEYTRDEFESFEDGFDLEGPVKFDSSKLKHFDSKQKPSLSTKASMPTFRNSTASSAKMKKYKSSINLHEEHPVFNNSNKIIKRLDRMPSFYSKPTQPDTQMNRDIELQKQELLAKFMEISAKQKKLNDSPNRNAYKKLAANPKRKIGLVRYLNDHTVPAASETSQMKFNPRSKRWEGNDIELMKFESENPSKPSLIKSEDFDSKKIHGNMIFDADQLKWISIDHDEEDVFQNLPNLEQESPTRIPRSATSRDLSPVRKPSPLRKSQSMRGVSQFTQRTVSTNSVSSTLDTESLEDGYEFSIPQTLVDRFHKEESKVIKKTKNWFNHNQTYKLHQGSFNHEYFWEIRKMVVEEEESE